MVYIILSTILVFCIIGFIELYNDYKVFKYDEKLIKFYNSCKIPDPDLDRSGYIFVLCPHEKYKNLLINRFEKNKWYYVKSVDDKLVFEYPKGGYNNTVMNNYYRKEHF